MRSRGLDLVVSTTILGVGMAVAGVGMAIAVALVDLIRWPIISLWKDQAFHSPAVPIGNRRRWFCFRHRCSKFEFICNLVEQHWATCNKDINHNAIFFIHERVALTLLYFTHSGNIVSSAKMFGMSKSSADRYIWQVINVVARALSQITICTTEL